MNLPLLRLPGHVGSGVAHDGFCLLARLVGRRPPGARCCLLGAAKHTVHCRIGQAFAAFDAVFHLCASRLRVLGEDIVDTLGTKKTGGV